MVKFARMIHQETDRDNYMFLTMYEYRPKSKGQGHVTSGLNVVRVICSQKQLPNRCVTVQAAL